MVKKIDVKDEKVKDFCKRHGLGVRISNCLYSQVGDTVGKFVVFTRRDLLRIPNLGVKSLDEVEAALAKDGLSLSDEKVTPYTEDILRELNELRAAHAKLVREHAEAVRDNKRLVDHELAVRQSIIKMADARSKDAEVLEEAKATNKELLNIVAGQAQTINKLLMEKKS